MPLAHLLAPQVAQKLNQIELDLGRQGYLAHSQLQGTQDIGAGSRDPVAPMPSTPKRKKGETASDAALRELRAQEKPGLMQTLRNAYIAKTMQNEKDAKMKRPIPLAPVAPQGLGFAVKPGTVVLPAGAVGMTESGASVDRKGKKTGYLADPNVRTLERRQGDQIFDRQRGLLTDDQLGVQAMQREFGDHLKARTFENGDMRFPAGYFDGMPAEKRKYIEDGVKHLEKLEKGVSI